MTLSEHIADPALAARLTSYAYAPDTRKEAARVAGFAAEPVLVDQVVEALARLPRDDFHGSNGPVWMAVALLCEAVAAGGDAAEPARAGLDVVGGRLRDEQPSRDDFAHMFWDVLGLYPDVAALVAVRRPFAELYAAAGDDDAAAWAREVGLDTSDRRWRVRLGVTAHGAAVPFDVDVEVVWAPLGRTRQRIRLCSQWWGAGPDHDVVPDAGPQFSFEGRGEPGGSGATISGRIGVPVRGIADVPALLDDLESSLGVHFARRKAHVEASPSIASARPIAAWLAAGDTTPKGRKPAPGWADEVRDPGLRERLRERSAFPARREEFDDLRDLAADADVVAALEDLVVFTDGKKVRRADPTLAWACGILALAAEVEPARAPRVADALEALDMELEDTGNPNREHVAATLALFDRS